MLIFDGLLKALDDFFKILKFIFNFIKYTLNLIYHFLISAFHTLLNPIKIFTLKRKYDQLNKELQNTKHLQKFNVDLQALLYKDKSPKNEMSVFSYDFVKNNDGVLERYKKETFGSLFYDNKLQSYCIYKNYSFVANYKEIDEGKVEFEYLSEISLSKKFKNIQRGFKSYFYEEYLYKLINDYRDLIGRDTWYKGKEISVYQNPIEIKDIEKNRFAMVLPNFDEIKPSNEIDNFKIVNYYCNVIDIYEPPEKLAKIETIEDSINHPMDVENTLRYCSIIEDKAFLNKEALPNYSCSISQYLEYLHRFGSLDFIKVSKSIFPTAIPLGFSCPNNHFINSDSLGVYLIGNCKKCNKKTDKSFSGGELRYILFKDKEYQFPTHYDGPNFLCNECQPRTYYEDDDVF